MATAQFRKTRQSILIWVDAKVQSNHSDAKNTIDKLRAIVDEVELIDTPVKCIQRLKELGQSKCYLITSGTFGKDLVPQVHSICHLESIFVFCGNKTYHETWVQQWNKIRGVHTKIEPICDELQPILRQVRHDDIAMSIISTGDEDQIDGKRLPPSFMYSSMLKDLFLDMKFEGKHRRKMIEMLLEKYSGNSKETAVIEEFVVDYRTEKAIWWYTRECFTYKDVNQGLRDLDGAIIVDMAPYIVDLHNQIKRLYEQQQKMFGRRSFTVYRGQGMIEEEFNKLRNSKNSLLSFNCFLSTSKVYNESVKFAKRGATRSGHVGVLFVIKINGSVRIIPYADIQAQSALKFEAEILFAMHSIFKIGKIEKLSSDSTIYQVQLHLTDEDDPKLIQLKTYMAGQRVGCVEHRLGLTLLDMGENNKAEEIYIDLLNTTTNERDKGTWNQQLGLIKMNQGEYERALQYYQKGVQIFEETLPENHPHIATSYNNIGSVCNNMKKYSEALTNYEKALEIYMKTLAEDHPDIAKTYCNIGAVYHRKGEYSKALEYYEKDLEISTKTLPENHPHIATSYCNIGKVYHRMGEYSRALHYYEKTMEIDKKTLPKTHPDIAKSYHNMGCLFYDMQKYKQALEYLEEARRIYTISLPPTHPDLKSTIDSIEIMRKDMK